MAKKIAIVATSGSGKSHSLKNLNPKTTVIIQATKKELPFQKDSEYVMGENKIMAEGNDILLVELKKLQKRKIQPSIIIIEDWSLMMVKETIRGRDEDNFKLYKKMGVNTALVLQAVDDYVGETIFVFMTHLEIAKNGVEYFKSQGEFVREKIEPKTMFTVVITMDDEYQFITNGSGIVKSPMGMFDDEYVQNDIRLILRGVAEYYNPKLKIKRLEKK